MLCIDAHLDLAYNALFWGRDLKKPVAEIREWERWMQGKGRGCNTVSLPDLRRGEVFLVFTTVNARHATGMKTALDFSPEGAYAVAQAQLVYYNLLEKQGWLRRLETASQVAGHVQAWTEAPDDTPIGYILCIEGADCLLEPEQVYDWWQNGLRVLSLAHYGPSSYAHGTNTEGGLFPRAHTLLKHMEELGVILDLTHTADGSFWEAIEVFGGRVIATHNNCRALVARQRQFTDDMIRAIVERDGVIGIAFDNGMIHYDFDMSNPNPEIVTLNTLAEHVDHICQLAGNARHVGFGTDLDGGYGKEQSPWDLDTVADLQKFPDLFRARGYSEADIQGMMRGNWLRLLGEALPQ